jgi:heptosyltransferase II
MMAWPRASFAASGADTGASAGAGASGTALRAPPAPLTQPRAAPASGLAPPRPAVVIQTSFLGDVILTTPLLAALAERGPVDVVTTPAAAPILARDPSVRAIIVYDKRGAARGIAGLWHTAQTLKSRFTLGGPPGGSPGSSPGGSPRPARTSGGNGGGASAESATPIAYLAQSSVRSGMLALLAGFQERVGFSTSPARALYSRTVPYRADRHHAERLWWLGAVAPDVEPLPSDIRPRLYPGPADVAAANAVLAAAHYDGEPLIALAPGSAWGAKRWPGYPALAAALAHAARIVVIGGADDQALAAEIRDAVGGPADTVIDATGKVPILGAAELIGRCVAIITNDSAPQHLASAMGTPTITIFGPTVPAFGFGPLAPVHATAGVDGLDCRPCDKHGPQTCPLGHWRCMRELTVAHIEQIVRQLPAASGP